MSHMQDAVRAAIANMRRCLGKQTIQRTRYRFAPTELNRLRLMRAIADYEMAHAEIDVLTTERGNAAGPATFGQRGGLA